MDKLGKILTLMKHVLLVCVYAEIASKPQCLTKGLKIYFSVNLLRVTRGGQGMKHE